MVSFSTAEMSVVEQAADSWYRVRIPRAARCCGIALDFFRLGRGVAFAVTIFAIALSPASRCFYLAMRFVLRPALRAGVSVPASLSVTVEVEADFSVEVDVAELWPSVVKRFHACSTVWLCCFHMCKIVSSLRTKLK